jgi:DNA-binding response OmpR family regulator
VEEFLPHVVLLDVMMPGTDGYELCRQIKSAAGDAFRQVILLSGRGTITERLRGYENLADDYLVKPFDHDELVAKVRV